MRLSGARLGGRCETWDFIWHAGSPVLRWRASLGDYTSVIARSGPVAAFDTLQSRAFAVIRLAGDANGRYATDSANLHARLTTVRASLADAAAHDDWTRLSRYLASAGRLAE